MAWCPCRACMHGVVVWHGRAATSLYVRLFPPKQRRPDPGFTFVIRYCAGRVRSSTSLRVVSAHLPGRQATMMWSPFSALFAFVVCLLLACDVSSGFTLSPVSSSSASHHDRSLTVLNGRRKGGLKESLEGDPKNPKSLNQGRGQEITGVTLPAEGKIKGWEFGNDLRMAAAQVEGNFYAVQGECPRCAFDLWKGTLVTDEAFGPDLPRVACPTCATTFSLKTGTHGPALKRTGLSGFVGRLAKTATINDASRDAKAYIITRDSETGQVFCKER